MESPANIFSDIAALKQHYGAIAAMRQGFVQNAATAKSPV
jgi:hypothetical protein